MNGISKPTTRILLSMMLFFIGFCLIIISIFTGGGKVFLLFFIPVFYGMGILALIGVICIMFGMVMLFYSFMFSIPEQVKTITLEDIDTHFETEKKNKFGGVIFIGPIPIIFGSDKNTMYIMLISALLFFMMIILLYLYFVFQ